MGRLVKRRHAQISIEQRAGRHFERNGETFHDGDRRIACASLEIADVGAVNAGTLGKLFLAPATLVASAAKVFGEALADIHPRK